MQSSRPQSRALTGWHSGKGPGPGWWLRWDWRKLQTVCGWWFWSEPQEYLSRYFSGKPSCRQGARQTEFNDLLKVMGHSHMLYHTQLLFASLEADLKVINTIMATSSSCWLVECGPYYATMCARANVCMCVSTIYTTFTMQSFDWSTKDEQNAETTLFFIFVKIVTCSHRLLFDMSCPVAIHWNVAFWPAFTSTSPRRRKWGDLSATNKEMEEMSKFTDWLWTAC